MSSYILTFLLFFLPFIILPLGVSHYEVPKVIIAEICIIVFVAIHYNQIFAPLKRLFPLRITRSNIVRNTHDNFFLLVGIFVLSLLTLALNYYPVTFLGNPFRWQGTFLLWLLLLFAAVSPLIKLRRLSPVIVLLLLFAHLYMGLSGTLNLEGRSVGTLGEPNAFAATAVFLWPWVLASRKKSRITIIYTMIGFVLALLIILLSGSRSGLVALGLQFVTFVAASFFSLQKTVIVAIVIFFMTLFLPFMDTTTVYENRGEVWKTALIAGFEHPVFGWGFGNTEVAFKEYNTRLYNTLQGYYVDSSHNFLLDWWIQGGIVGLAFIIVLLREAIYRFLSLGNNFKIILFFGLLVVMSFNPVSIVTLIQFWWLLRFNGHESNA